MKLPFLMHSTSEIIGSVISAFIIGSGGALSVGIVAGNGKLNTLSVILIVATGAVSAAKDYRSLMRLPPVEKITSFDSAPPFKQNITNKD